MSFVETCRQFIGLDSTPSRGNREAVEFAAQLCRDAGLEVELDKATLNGLEQANLMARWGSSMPQANELLLQAHLDTSEPGHFASWTKTQANPFNASIYDNTLYGLGVADAKLDFLCKLEAVKKIKQKKLRRPFVLAGTYGAYQGMAGAVKLLRKKKVNARLALVGAPTNLQVSTSGYGTAVVEIQIPFSEEEREYRLAHDTLESGSTQSKIFLGKASEGANVTLAENAIVKMLDYLAQLPMGLAIMDLEGGVSHDQVPDSAVLEVDVVGSLKDPIVPRLGQIVQGLRHMEEKLSRFSVSDDGTTTPTVNLGMIHTYADYIRLTGSCRLPPGVIDKDYAAWVEEMRQICNRVGARFSLADYKGAFVQKNDSQMVRQCTSIIERAGASPAHLQFSTSTEANVFHRFGIECILFGPGVSTGNVHGPNEQVHIADLERAINLYEKLIVELCE